MKKLSIEIALGVMGSFMVSSMALAQDKYGVLEDAATAQAKIWQAGGKARPLMSSDGKVVFAYGQSMPKLTCSPTRACDVEMQGGEKVKKVILGDGVNWTWTGADSVERGQPVQHVVFQPKDVDLESNVIITTDRRTYHIKLYAPKVEGAYLNRVGFYYPEDLVQSWSDKMGDDAAAAVREESLKVMPAAVSPDKLAFDYRLEWAKGNGDFMPKRVFNDGERVYIEMADSVRSGENPVLALVDEQGKEVVVNYRRQEDPATGTVHFVVDKLFAKAVLVGGTEKVLITWKRKEKSVWGWAR